MILWIEEAVALHGFVPPRISVHSANASAVLKMQAGVLSIEALARRNRHP